MKANAIRVGRYGSISAESTLIMRPGARNQLQGTVTKVNKGVAIANVEVDVAGQRLVSSVTVEAVEELWLSERTAVTAVIKGLGRDPRG